MAKWLSSNPAKFLKLTNKGKISIGADADFFIWDSGRQQIIDESQIFHRHKISPYANKLLMGEVLQTYLAGELIYENKKLIKAHLGRILIEKN